MRKTKAALACQGHSVVTSVDTAVTTVLMAPHRATATLSANPGSNVAQLNEWHPAVQALPGPLGGMLGLSAGDKNRPDGSRVRPSPVAGASEFEC